MGTLNNDSGRSPPLDTATSPSSTPTLGASYRGYAGRRGKAAVMLLLIWGGGDGSSFPLLGHVGDLGTHRLSGGPWSENDSLSSPPRRQLTPMSTETSLPYVSFLIPAKNEEAAITPLIEMLNQLDYPGDRYDIWAIDDNSSDGTPELLDALSQDYGTSPGLTS